jgi:mannose-1-phosphate guanylyltransferase / mannose-6-phosphate isomerase
MAKLHTVILCGGAGARLWPISRELYPKQFLRLIGEHTLLQQTVMRAREASDAPPIIVCNHEQRFIVAEQLRELGCAARIVLEPARRDSGPAIAAAAEIVAREDEAGLLLALPSDHRIDDVAAFAGAVAEARAGAEAGRIVTFGIAPTRAATEFGYIRPGPAIGVGRLRAVEAFVEKPDAARAARYLADGFLWNSGMFLFRARDLLDDLAAFEPAMASAVRHAVDVLGAHDDFEQLGEVAFLSSPARSIDYAVMERTKRAAVLPASFVWSDVGSWAALWEIEERDAAGNACIGPVEALDTHGSYLRSDGLLTAVVGLDGVVVVATDDAVLVAAKDQAQQVKELVAGLKQRARPEVTAHTTLYRPWGTMQAVDGGSGFEVKRLMIRPGAKISLHRHRLRAEHWVVVRGRVLATLGDDTRPVSENESVYVPAGLLHRIANPGEMPAEVIEVRTGALIREDDIERVEDAYGRMSDLAVRGAAAE